MLRFLAPIALTAALALLATTPATFAQDKAPPKAAKSSSPKVGPDEKVCRYKFPGGESRTWVCKKAEPCCAWDAISYVKCGSTITGCL